MDGNVVEDEGKEVAEEGGEREMEVEVKLVSLIRSGMRKG